MAGGISIMQNRLIQFTKPLYPHCSCPSSSIPSTFLIRMRGLAPVTIILNLSRLSPTKIVHMPNRIQNHTWCDQLSKDNHHHEAGEILQPLPPPMTTPIRDNDTVRHRNDGHRRERKDKRRVRGVNTRFDEKR